MLAYGNITVPKKTILLSSVEHDKITTEEYISIRSEIKILYAPSTVFNKSEDVKIHNYQYFYNTSIQLLQALIDDNKEDDIISKTQTNNENIFEVHLCKDDFADKTLSPFAPCSGEELGAKCFEINIGHPTIRPYYNKYKELVNEKFYLVGKQRFDFEGYVLAELKRINIHRQNFVKK